MPQSDPSEAVDALVAEWVDARRNGRRDEGDAILRRCPESAADLSSFLEDYERIEERFAPLRRLADETPRGAAEVVTLREGDTATDVPQAACGSFGDYDLLGEVARGGMGIVYKARQRSLNRVVALKMLLGGGREPAKDRDRFLVEARAVARLNHPHIVPIYEVGEQNGESYFTMEFFAGGSLRDRVDELRRNPRELARTLATTARAIEHAHRRGILHRDLKPGNVLLDDRRQPHVADFGLARRLEEESDLTQSGAIVGTPSYMAPEQIRAENDLTTAVDVYGLGALMYELLTCQPPFTGKSPLETMMAATSREPQHPRKLAPDVDPDLATICLKCLEKDPLARYGSADALADDLERWLDGRPIQARPATTVERLVKWSRRQPILAGSLGTLVAAALGLLVLAGCLWQNAEARAEAVQNLDEAKTQLTQLDGQRKQAESKKSKAEELAAEQRKIADQQKALAEKIKAEIDQLERAADVTRRELAAARIEARRTSYAADMQLAQAAWHGENFSTSIDLLERYRDPGDREDVRGFEWNYLERQLHRARRTWRDAPEAAGGLSAIIGMSISPDGKTLVTAQPGSRLSLWNLADGTLLRTIRTKESKIQGISFGNVTGVFFEDEGRKVVAVARKGFDMWQMDKYVAAAMAKKAKLDISSLGDAIEFQVASVEGDGAVKVEPFDPKRLATAVFPLLAGSFFVVDDGSILMVMAVDRSADGRYLAVSGSETRVAGGDPKNPGRLAGGRLVVWDLIGNKIHAERKFAVPVSAAAFSPKGDQIAIGGADGVLGVSRLDLVEAPRNLTGHSGGIYSLQFNGDGSQLASGAMDGLAILWDVASLKEVDRFRGHTSPVGRIAFTPDNRTLITGAQDGTLKQWILVGNQPLNVLPCPSGPVATMIFADDKRLLTADQKGAVTTWQLPEGAAADPSKPPNARGFIQLRLSPSGHRMAWKDGLGDAIQMRDVAGGPETRLQWKGHHPFQVVFSPDETLVASASIEPAGLIVWRIADGQELATLPGDKELTMGLTFSSDGRFVAAAQGKGVVLWDWKAGTSRRLMAAEAGAALAVAFSADGRLLAASMEAGARSSQSIVRIWDLAADRLHCEFIGAGQQVRHLAFSPDGRRLATGGTTSAQRGILKLWETNAGREVFSPPLPPTSITAIAWSPDGFRLAAALATTDLAATLTARTRPGEVYVWDASPSVP